MAPSEGEQTFESAVEEERSRIGDEPATAAGCVAPVEDSASVGILVMREKRKRRERTEMAALLHLLAGVERL